MEFLMYSFVLLFTFKLSYATTLLNDTDEVFEGHDTSVADDESSIAKLFLQAKIVPEAIDSPPHDKVDVMYGDTCIDPGMSLPYVGTDLKFTFAPTVNYDGDEDELYTLLMIDLDAIIPGFLQLPGLILHWAVSNIKGRDVQSGNEIETYIKPLTPPLGRSHRYTFLVYKQNEEIEFDLADLLELTASRLPFDLKGFVKKYALGDPCYGNFFYGTTKII